jgi:hypothetical protein
MGGISVQYNALPVAEVVEEQPRSAWSRSRALVLACAVSLVVVGVMFAYQQDYTRSNPQDFLPPPDDQPNPDDILKQFEPAYQDYPKLYNSEGRPLDAPDLSRKGPPPLHHGNDNSLDAPDHIIPRTHGDLPPPIHDHDHDHHDDYAGEPRPSDRDDPLFPPPPPKKPLATLNGEKERPAPSSSSSDSSSESSSSSSSSESSSSSSSSDSFSDSTSSDSLDD